MLIYYPFPLIASALALWLHLPKVLAQNDETFEWDHWENFNPDPDVWGSVPIPGPRLDKPYPGAWDKKPAPDAGWRLDLGIKGQLYMEEHDRNITLLTMQFRPPPTGRPGAVMSPQSGKWSVPSNVTSTWKVSLVSLIRRNALENFREVGEPNDDVDGSCPESVVSATCVSEIRERIASRRSVLEGRYVENSVPFFGEDGGDTDIMPVSGSCDEYFDLYWSTSVELNDGFNESSIDAYVPWATSLSGEDLGVYDSIGRKTFLSMIVWGHGNNTEVGKPIPVEHVTFACVKADNVKEGIEGPKGAANSVRGLLPVVGISAAVVVVLTEMLF